MVEEAGRLLAFATLVSLSAYAALIDARTQTIPDWASLALLAGGLLLSATSGLVPLESALAASVLSGLLLWSVSAVFRTIRGHDGLGFGDVKFVAAASTWTGVESVALALLIACATALAYVLLRQAIDASFDRGARVPFCPFLALGFVTVAGVQLLLGAPLFAEAFATLADGAVSG